MEGGDSQAADLAKRDLECESSKRYKGFVVRSRLCRFPNEAVKRNAFDHKEEFRKFPCRVGQVSGWARVPVEPWYS